MFPSLGENPGTQGENPGTQGENPGTHGENGGTQEQLVRDRARGCVLWSYHRNFSDVRRRVATAPRRRPALPRAHW